MIREEWAEDLASPEPEKISAIQIATGSQYLMNERNFDTIHTETDSARVMQTLMLSLYPEGISTDAGIHIVLTLLVEAAGTVNRPGTQLRLRPVPASVMTESNPPAPASDFAPFWGRPCGN